MPNPEHIIIPKGAEINYENTEDGDSLVANEDIIAIPVGPVIDGGLPVVIPSLDSERTFFYHQPEGKSK